MCVWFCHADLVSVESVRACVDTVPSVCELLFPGGFARMTNIPVAVFYYVGLKPTVEGGACAIHALCTTARLARCLHDQRVPHISSPRHKRTLNLGAVESRR